MIDGQVVFTANVRGQKMTQGFYFCIAAWMYLTDYTQLAIYDWDKIEDVKLLPKINYCAAWAYNHYKGIATENLTEDSVREFTDAMTIADGRRLMSAILESRIGGESLADLLPRTEIEKKKSRGIRLETLPSV